jgi:hypothetical protein
VDKDAKGYIPPSRNYRPSQPVDRAVEVALATDLALSSFRLVDYTTLLLRFCVSKIYCS